MELKYEQDKAMLYVNHEEEDEGWKMNCRICDAGFDTMGFDIDSGTVYEIGVESYEEYKRLLNVVYGGKEMETIVISLESYNELLKGKMKAEAEANDYAVQLVQQKARADRFMLAVLDEHYNKFGSSEKGRLEISDFSFGLDKPTKLLEMGISYEQMVDYIERKDAERGAEDEPKF